MMLLHAELHVEIRPLPIPIDGKLIFCPMLLDVVHKSSAGIVMQTSVTGR
jgi:hypothetical protein